MKLLLSIGLLLAVVSVRAQKFDDARTHLTKGEYNKAVAVIDKLLEDPKNRTNADAWLFKAEAYAALTKEKSDLKLARAAEDALKQYVALEAGKEEARRFMTSKLQGHRTFFDVYSALFKTGADGFNNKDYATAYKGFSGAFDMFDILAKYKMTDVPFDTTSALYAGVAAESANMPDEAVKYYSKIVGLKIPDTTHLGVYGYLINYYTAKKDLSTAASIIDKAEALFPARSDTWMSFRIEMAGPDSLARMNQYEYLLKKYPNHMMLNNDYAIEMYRYVYFNDKRASDTTWTNKLKKAYRNAVKHNPTVINNYVMMSILADDANWLQNQIGRLPAGETAKKASLQARLTATLDELLIYAQQAAAQFAKMGNLKASDKANYKRVLQNIIDIYKDRGKASSAAPYETALKGL